MNLSDKAMLVNLSISAWSGRKLDRKITGEVTAAHYLGYQAEIGKFERAFNLAADNFVRDYDVLVYNARSGLGDMFSESDYPSAGEVRSKFSFSVKFLPLPSGDDFRVDLSAGDVARIKADIEGQVQGATVAAMADLWGRLHCRPGYGG